MTTLIVDADDNAGVTINSLAATSSLTVQDASGVVDDVTLTGGVLTLTASTNDGDLTATTTGNFNITDADAVAGAVNITSGGYINIDALEAATTVTLSGVGTGTNASNWTEGDNTAAVTTINISGNGAAHQLTAATGDLTVLTTVTATGTEDVIVSLSGADIDLQTLDKLTFTDSTTGTATTTLALNTVGLVNTTLVGADSVRLDADFGNSTITMGTGQTLGVAVAQTGSGTQALALTMASATSSTNALTIDLLDDAAAATALGTGIFTITNVKETTINALDTTIANDMTSLNVGAANNVTVNSAAKGVTFTTDVTANTLTLNTASATTLAAAINNSVSTVNAAGSTGAITVTAGTKLTTITTGSGADTITLSGATSNATVNGGAGTDILDVATLDLGAETITLTGIETIHADNGADLKGSVLSGKSYVLTDTTASATVTLIADSATLNLGTLAVDAGTIANIAINATAQATAGATLVITGTDTKETVDATGATGTVTLNLGAGNDIVTATGSNADTINTGAGDDVVTTSGAGLDTIDLGAGADTLTTAAGGNDIITAGEGVDIIVGGAGGDSINLTETTAAIDYVTYTALTDGSAAGAGGGTFTGFDVITGFKSTSDKLVFDSGTLDTDVDTAIIAAKTVFASTAATAAANDMVQADYADVDSVFNFLTDVDATGHDNDIVSITFTDFTALYQVNDGGDALAETEIKLIGTVDEVLVTGDVLI